MGVSPTESEFSAASTPPRQVVSAAAFDVSVEVVATAWFSCPLMTASCAAWLAMVAWSVPTAATKSARLPRTTASSAALRWSSVVSAWRASIAVVVAPRVDSSEETRRAVVSAKVAKRAAATSNGARRGAREPCGCTGCPGSSVAASTRWVSEVTMASCHV